MALTVSEGTTSEDIDQGLNRAGARLEHEFNRHCNGGGDLHSGNNVFSEAYEADNNFPVILEENLPRSLAEFEGSMENADLVSALLENDINTKQAIEIFFDMFLSDDERDRFQRRLDVVRLGKASVGMYGCSGTEENSKEIGNIVGMIHNVERLSKKPSVGLYFVEDNGHPIDWVVNDERKFAASILEKSGETPEEAQVIAEQSYKSILCSCRTLDYYDPNGRHVNNFIEKTRLEGEDANNIRLLFSQMEEALISGRENLFQPGNNLSSPDPEVLRIELARIGLDSEVIEIHYRVANYLRSKELEGTVTTFSDYKTMVQGVINLIASYRAFGVDEMPIVLTSKWSTICNYHPINAQFTIYEASQALKELYGEKAPGKLVNAACPVTKMEVEIDANGKTKTEDSPFKAIIKKAGHLPLGDWVWGGNSGKLYYVLMDRLFSQEVTGFIFADDYEANGPHTGIVSNHKKGENYLTVYPPKARPWSISGDLIPMDGNKINGDAAMGQAIPSSYMLNNLNKLPLEVQQQILFAWMYPNEPGLSRGLGYLMTSLNSAQVGVIEDLTFFRHLVEFDLMPSGPFLGMEGRSGYLELLMNFLETGEGLEWFIESSKQHGFNIDVEAISQYPQLKERFSINYSRFEDLRARNTELAQILNPFRSASNEYELTYRRRALDQIIKLGNEDMVSPLREKNLSKYLKSQDVRRFTEDIDYSSEVEITTENDANGFNGSVRVLTRIISDDVIYEVNQEIGKLGLEVTQELVDAALGYYYSIGSLEGFAKFSLVASESLFDRTINLLREKNTRIYELMIERGTSSFSKLTQSFVEDKYGINTVGMHDVARNFFANGRNSIKLTAEQRSVFEIIYEIAKKPRSGADEVENIDVNSLNDHQLHRLFNKVDNYLKRTGGDNLEIFTQIVKEIQGSDDIRTLFELKERLKVQVQEFFYEERELQQVSLDLKAERDYLISLLKHIAREVSRLTANAQFYEQFLRDFNVLYLEQ